MVRDPVCGMDVDENKSQFKSEHQGQTYHFCADQCKQKFERYPDKFAKK
ncbi:MAG: YHS domain-containing protein [Candidatus Bathyarchaeia archaeon]